MFKPSQTYTFNITIKSNIGVASNTELDLGFLESGAGVSFLSISSLIQIFMLEIILSRPTFKVHET